MSTKASGTNGKDASNLALIYSTLAVMGKKMEQQQGKDLPFPLQAGVEHAQMHNRSNDPAASYSAAVFPKPATVGSAGTVSVDAETLTIFSKNFDNLVEQFKYSSTCAYDSGGDEMQASGDPASVSTDTEANANQSMFLRHDFVMEFKLLIDGEVRHDTTPIALPLLFLLYFHCSCANETPGSRILRARCNSAGRRFLRASGTSCARSGTGWPRTRRRSRPKRCDEQMHSPLRLSSTRVVLCSVVLLCCVRSSSRSTAAASRRT